MATRRADGPDDVPCTQDPEEREAAQGDPARAGRLPHQGHGRPRARGRACGPRTAGWTTSTAPASSWPATSTGRDVAELARGAARRGRARRSASAGSRVLRVTTDGDHDGPGHPGAGRPASSASARPPPTTSCSSPGRGGGYACPAIEPEEPGRGPRAVPRHHQRPRGRHRGVRLRGGHRLVAARRDRPGVAVAGRAWTATRRPSTSPTSTRTPGTGPSSPASSAPRPRPRRSGSRASCRLGGAVYESEIVVQLGEALEPTPGHHLAVGRLPDARRGAAAELRGLLGAAAAPPEGHGPGRRGGQRRAPQAVLAGGLPVVGLGRCHRRGRRACRLLQLRQLGRRLRPRLRPGQRLPDRHLLLPRAAERRREARVHRASPGGAVRRSRRRW